MAAATILVVDDQYGVRRLLEELFAAEGYRVVAAAHGREALERAQANPPDLAFVDIRMPVMDGVETLRQLQARWPGLPVVMMTAVGDTDQVSAALALGARATVTKPFDIHAVCQLARSLLAGSGAPGVGDGAERER